MGVREPLCFFCLGVAVLLSWNSVILAFGWFREAAKVGLPAGEPAPGPLQSNLSSIFSAVFSLFNASSVILASRSPRFGRLRSVLTVPLPLLLSALLFALLSVAAFLNSKPPLKESLGGSVLFFSALPLLAALGVLTALANCGTAHMAGHSEAHSGRALNANSVGQAVAGLVPAVVAFLSTPPDNVTLSQQALAQQACGTFAFTAATLVASTFAYAALPRGSEPTEAAQAAPADQAAAPAEVAAPPALQVGEFSLTTPLLAAAEGEAAGGEDPLGVAAEEGLDDEAAIAEEERLRSTLLSAEMRLQLRLHYASSLLTFLVSLAVFPGLTGFLKPANAQLDRDTLKYTGTVELPGLSFRGNLLVPATFVVFGAGDVLGRLLAGVLPRLGSRPLFGLCVARAALVPMLLCCHMVPDSTSQHWLIGDGAFARDDTSPIALLSLLAITNGYAFTVAFAAGPDCVPAGERGRVAQTLVACLVSGVVLGSLCSLLLSVVMQPKN